jgi:hypothetical protein
VKKKKKKYYPKTDTISGKLQLEINSIDDKGAVIHLTLYHPKTGEQIRDISPIYMRVGDTLRLEGLEWIMERELRYFRGI